MNSLQPMFITWGKSATFLYNDAYIHILGSKHPNAFGLPLQMVCNEVWYQVGKKLNCCITIDDL